MKMKLNLNQNSTTISSPFMALFSSIIDFKGKLKAQEVTSETESQSSMGEKPVQENNQSPKKFKLNFNKINLNFFKKINFEKLNSYKVKVKKHPKISFAILALILVGGLILFRMQGKSQGAQASSNSQDSFAVQKQVTINKQFNIPIRTAKGEDSGDKLKITLTTIDNTNKILIQGQPATARDGKSFLILNLEVENSTKNQLTVRPVDLIRMVDSQNKSFAPDIHNNDVTVEAISIKKTRAGYVIDNAQKNFKFLIGEVSGKKETVEVNLN